jgi:hypothetical protein
MVVGDYRGTLTAARSPGWPSGTYGETRVIYTAGYPTVPLDLVQCCVEFTIALWRFITKSGGQWVSSTSYQGFALSLLAESQTPQMASLRQKLAPYRELAVS